MIGGGDRLALRRRGLVADTATAALVAADGTVDWWCPRRIDAPAALFRLLDPDGGAVRVGPVADGPPVPGRQRYDGATNVLRTLLPTTGAEVEVCDFLPFDDGPRPPSGRLVRMVTVRGGSAEVEVALQPGHAFGPARRVVPFSRGVAFDGVVLRTGFPMEGRSGRRRLEPGEVLVVTVDAGEGLEPLAPGPAADLRRRTVDAWRRRAGEVAYDGPHRALVERSVLVLEALTQQGTGAVVASPTTSLPAGAAAPGAGDGRFAWWGDAAGTTDAWYRLGLVEQAEARARWLSSALATALVEGGLPLAAACDVAGEPAPAEAELALAGWRGARPVRVGRPGDAAAQPATWAELVAAVPVERLRRGMAVAGLWGPLADGADWLAEQWRRPDAGAWDERGPARPFVATRLASWFALDRMTALGLARNPLDLATVAWREEAGAVLAWLEEHGVDAAGCLRAVAPSGSEPGPDRAADGALDAALLAVAWRGPWPPPHRHVAHTVDQVLGHLGRGPFVLPGPSPAGPDGQGDEDGDDAEGTASVVASFWAVRALARLGRFEEAHERMEGLAGFARPLGLLPVAADPRTGDFLGNLPSAPSHLAAIEAALALAEGPA